MHRRYRQLGAFVALIALVGVTGSTQAATPTDTTALQNAVDVGDRIPGSVSTCTRCSDRATEPGANGTRATGTQGHEHSVAYVMSQLDTGYWDVTTQPFTADVFSELAPPDARGDPAADRRVGRNRVDYATMDVLRHRLGDRRAGRGHRLRRADGARRARRAPAARTPTSRRAASPARSR